MSTLLKLSRNIGIGIVIIASLMKIQHYPYALEALILGVLVFSPFWLTAIHKVTQVEKNPITKWTWLILVILIPIIGSICYLSLKTKAVKTESWKLKK